MTAGRVIVIGRTDQNFAAALSGGVASEWDADGTFDSRCNDEFVDLDPLNELE